MNIRLILFSLFFVINLRGFTQVHYTANTHHTTYTMPFGFGANLGVFPGWDDESLAALVAGDAQMNIPGLNGNSIRLALPADFLEQWGYDIRKDAFQYYRDIGINNIVAFVGYPNDAMRDPVQHCPGSPSQMFKNMYAPIWDGGANGTAINDTNYYAAYLWKTLQIYGDMVDIWEVTNEPDLTGSTASYAGPEDPDSWWNRDPEACELYIKAPVQYYVRMLRITYEVVKFLQPDDYIAIGGIGYPSFLDAVLRNTDNPDGGQSTSEYPLKGGAYFDVLSFHSYPHIDNSMRHWSNATGGFVYSRHSDRAVDNGYLRLLNEYKKVLEDHLYTGSIFPKKHFIVTETNVPRKQYGEFLGSDEAQRNYTMKVLLKSIQHDIKTVNLFTVAEKSPYFANEFSYMGLYKQLPPAVGGPLSLTEQGIAFKTTALLAKGYVYDAGATEALQLPADADGMALRNATGRLIYALWAKTNQDRSEYAHALVTLPVIDAKEAMAVYHWDHSVTGNVDTIPGNVLTLTGTPVFVKPIKEKIKQAFDIKTQLHPNPTSIELELAYTLFDEAGVQIDILDMHGNIIQEVLPLTDQTAGVYSQSINTEFFPAGMYVLRIRAKQLVKLLKFTVIHEY